MSKTWNEMDFRWNTESIEWNICEKIYQFKKFHQYTTRNSKI